MIIDTIKVIKADEGMILTDGEIFGRTILLPENRTADEFSEITEVEYNEIIKVEKESCLETERDDSTDIAGGDDDTQD